VGGLQCLKGMLLYPNKGNFSGLLSFTPAVESNAAEFESLRQNQHQIEFFIGFSIFFVLFLCGYIES
jgi:hypothetical protein